VPAVLIAAFCKSDIACCLHLMLVFADLFPLSRPSQQGRMHRCIAVDSGGTAADESCSLLRHSASNPAMQMYAEAHSMQLLANQKMSCKLCV
jgi:hypothetical protein